jgi:hypothetical protein
LSGLIASPTLQCRIPRRTCQHFPAVDDTFLKKFLPATLEGARNIVGSDCIAEARAHLFRNDHFLADSCFWAAMVVAALGMTKDQVGDDDYGRP